MAVKPAPILPLSQTVTTKVCHSVRRLPTSPLADRLSPTYIALVPVDCPPSDTEEGVQGMIRDNDLREILVDRLPIGCHLTVGPLLDPKGQTLSISQALFDCCHSGSILDLRHCYPRYLSIPYAWYTSGPAHAHPRCTWPELHPHCWTLTPIRSEP